MRQCLIERDLVGLDFQEILVALLMRTSLAGWTISGVAIFSLITGEYAG